jgi:CBS domain-containing protein
MREHHVGCLPVVQGKTLVGILTEHDFTEIARQLLDEKLAR